MSDTCNQVDLRTLNPPVAFPNDSMDKMIARFPAQLKEALEIAREADISPLDGEVTHIYVAGLGGSGIGANFVAEFAAGQLKIPYLIGKSYEIPAYIGEKSLCICSSYSGNTEETLAAYEAMRAKNARIIAISSGGRLIEQANEHGYDFIRLPGNWSSPRACLGYSLVQQLGILAKLGLTDNSYLEQVEKSAAMLEKESDDIKSRAEKIAGMLEGKIPVIYITDRMESVAVRFRQQVNENAKALAWHHVIPEMNHNELVGWRDSHEELAVIFFRNRDDYPRNQMRIDIIKEIIGNYASSLIELYSKGDSLVERAMYFVHLGDWISWYLAQLRNVDAVEVKVIDFLKQSLKS